MSKVYYRGDNVFLYIQFKDEDGNVISVDNALVRILHDKDGDILEDLPWTHLQQMSVNEYFLNYQIPYNADLGQYQVIYIGETDDKEAYTMETIHVITKSDKYLNTIKLYGYVLDIRTETPLIDSNISIYDTQYGDKVYQSLTNEQGYWEAYVYPGEYRFEFYKSKFEKLEISAQIGDEHNEMQFNNVGLESLLSYSKGNGAYTIGDRYTLKNGQPLFGLSIKIYDVFNPTNPPVAEDITNDNGEWQCFLDAGDYLLKITGMSLSKNFNKTFRLKVDNNGDFTFEDLSRNVATMSNGEYINSGDGSEVLSDIILDSKNNPIIDVQVNAYNPSNLNVIIAQTYTDVNGKWKLKLNPGNYIIEFYHPKFKVKTEKRTI